MDFQPTSSTSTGAGLGHLPHDVLLIIIPYLRAISRTEFGRVLRGKREAAAHLKPGSQMPIVLNSFQSFAVVNQHVYTVCRPFLWEVSKAQLQRAVEPRPLTFFAESRVPDSPLRTYDYVDRRHSTKAR